MNLSGVAVFEKFHRSVDYSVRRTFIACNTFGQLADVNSWSNYNIAVNQSIPEQEFAFKLLFEIILKNSNSDTFLTKMLESGIFAVLTTLTVDMVLLYDFA